jgi:hypothetical protein
MNKESIQEALEMGCRVVMDNLNGKMVLSTGEITMMDKDKEMDSFIIRKTIVLVVAFGKKEFLKDRGNTLSLMVKNINAYGVQEK